LRAQQGVNDPAVKRTALIKFVLLLFVKLVLDVSLHFDNFSEFLLKLFPQFFQKFGFLVFHIVIVQLLVIFLFRGLDLLFVLGIDEVVVEHGDKVAVEEVFNFFDLPIIFKVHTEYFLAKYLGT